MQSYIILKCKVIFKCASNIILLWEQINPLVSPFFLSKLFIHKLRFIDDGSSCFFVHILFTYSSVLGIKNFFQKPLHICQILCLWAFSHVFVRFVLSFV